jgi:hypothetical protein
MQANEVLAFAVIRPDDHASRRDIAFRHVALCRIADVVYNSIGLFPP